MNLSAEEITKRVILETMSNIENYLKFTIESPDDFQGWLPTLNTSLRVNKDNVVQFQKLAKKQFN